MTCGECAYRLKSIGRFFRSFGGRATVLARAVVSDRHLAGEVVERGDDGDAARRSRHDARPRPCAAFAAAERLRVTVDADGADIAREREKSFRERFCRSPKWKELVSSGECRYRVGARAGCLLAGSKRTEILALR